MRTARSPRESPPQAAKIPSSPAPSAAPSCLSVTESPFRAAADQAEARAEAARIRLAWVAEQRRRLADRIAALPPVTPAAASSTAELRTLPNAAPSEPRQPELDDRESLSA